MKHPSAGVVFVPAAAGAPETLAPDAIITQTNLGGAVTDIDESPDSDNGDWLTSTADTGVLRVSFPTPSAGNPTGTQSFRARLRKDASGGGTPTYTMELYESGSLVATLATDVGVDTADPGEVISHDWNASLLGTADGSAVECRMAFTDNGGGPNKRNMEVGAVEWAKN